MASNAPQQPSGAKHQLLGIPLWGWAAAAGALLIGLFVFYRQSSSTGSQTPIATVPNSLPMPFSGATGAAFTQSQQFGQYVAPSLAWQFGTPPGNPSTWVWQPTGSGMQQFKQRTGADYTAGIQPGTVDPNQFGFGQFGWEWARLPNGEGYQQYITGVAPSTNSAQGILIGVTNPPGTGSGLMEGDRSQMLNTYPPQSITSNINSASMPSAVG